MISKKKKDVVSQNWHQRGQRQAPTQVSADKGTRKQEPKSSNLGAMIKQRY